MQPPGYLLDAPYPDTFFRELSPAWLNYVALLKGAPACDLERPFAYLELGCGLGSSVITFAGAFPQGQFHACDFNPQYIEQASRRAAEFGIPNVEFHARSFADLRSQSLPLFDFIVVHGVYSWVGAPHREAIRQLVHDRLKAGGLLYISYNSLPGWSAEVPLRRWLLELSGPETADTPTRVRQALASLRDFGGLGLRFFEANPAATAAVESYGRAPASYLAHEFFNAAWEPFYCIDVADQMAEAQVSYLGSATLAENHASLFLDDAAGRAIGRLPTDRQRRLATDFATNQQFRRDVFLRAPQGGAGAGQGRRLGATPIGCTGEPDQLTSRVKVPRGFIRFQEDFIQQLARVMSGGSVSFDAAIAALGAGGTGAAEIARNLTYLIAGGALSPFAKTYRSVPLEAIRHPVNRIVARVLKFAVDRGIECILPSEIVGGGVKIQPDEALAVTQWLSGRRDGNSGPATVQVARLARLGLLC